MSQFVLSPAHIIWRLGVYDFSKPEDSVCEFIIVELLKLMDVVRSITGLKKESKSWSGSRKLVKGNPMVVDGKFDDQLLIEDCDPDSWTVKSFESAYPKIKTPDDLTTVYDLLRFRHYIPMITYKQVEKLIEHTYKMRIGELKDFIGTNIFSIELLKINIPELSPVIIINFHLKLTLLDGFEIPFECQIKSIIELKKVEHDHTIYEIERIKSADWLGTIQSQLAQVAKKKLEDIGDQEVKLRIMMIRRNLRYIMTNDGSGTLFSEPQDMMRKLILPIKK
jgi:hypothetical protein